MAIHLLRYIPITSGFKGTFLLSSAKLSTRQVSPVELVVDLAEP